MISLKQLSYAIAVAKTLHFKKAAEQCHVSQSAMSTAISELEKHLDLVIFERNNKQVLITPQGRVFIEKAQAIKCEIDELYHLGQKSKAPLSAPMSVGVIPTIGPYLLPKVLPKVRADYPEFKLRIIEEQSHVLVDSVRRGDIDVAILALPYDIDGLMALEFWQEDFYWVCHKSQCANTLTEITGAELALEQLMLLKDGHCLKDHALAACQLPKQEKDNAFNATSLHTLVQMVAGKLGSTLVPQMALDQLIHNQSELHAVHLNEPSPHRRIAFIMRPNYGRTADIELLMAMFENQLTRSVLPAVNRTN